jgi:hypothetical protein
MFFGIFPLHQHAHDMILQHSVRIAVAARTGARQ